MAQLSGGRTVYGLALGIIMLDTRFPRLRGDIGNAKTKKQIPGLLQRFMDLGGLVPDETHEKLRERLDAQSEQIREAEKAA